MGASATDLIFKQAAAADSISSGTSGINIYISHREAAVLDTASFFLGITTGSKSIKINALRVISTRHDVGITLQELGTYTGGTAPDNLINKNRMQGDSPILLTAVIDPTPSNFTTTISTEVFTAAGLRNSDSPLETEADAVFLLGPDSSFLLGFKNQSGDTCDIGIRLGILEI